MKAKRAGKTAPDPAQKEAKDLFASGWTVTDIGKKAGIPRQIAEKAAHEYLLEQAESSNWFRRESELVRSGS